MPEGHILGPFPVTVIDGGGRRRGEKLIIRVRNGQVECEVSSLGRWVVAPNQDAAVVAAYQRARGLADRQLGRQQVGDEPG